MITKNRDAVRASWDAQTKALYAARRKTSEEESLAKDALSEAQARMRLAKKNSKAADAAFAATEAGREFWSAVRRDIAEEDLAANAAPSVP